MKYATIVADPPWPMPESGRRSGGNLGDRPHAITKGKHAGRVMPSSQTWWGTMEGKSVKLPYETMTLAEIAALPVSEIAEKNAHLYLWTTNRFLEDAYEIVRAWGFKPAQMLVWCKPPQGVGMGGAFTTTTEFVIFARRGTLAHKARQDSSWWRWSRPHIAHSAKPEAFLDLVEQVSPGPYLEMFSRRARLGWMTWGNEALHGTEAMSA